MIFWIFIANIPIEIPKNSLTIASTISQTIVRAWYLEWLKFSKMEGNLEVVES